MGKNDEMYSKEYVSGFGGGFFFLFGVFWGFFFFLLVILSSKISKARIIVIHAIIYRKNCFSFEKMSTFGPSCFSI